MIFDNSQPRYLPHMEDPEVLLMGLSPMGERRWIETDYDIGRYHQHKLSQRAQPGKIVYRFSEASLPAQQELSRLLLDHLLLQTDSYRVQGDQLQCIPGNFTAPLESNDPLWNCSLWIADDLVIMEKLEDDYCLTAASLCSPSHWRLEEKFNQSMRAIHDPIPGFHAALTPRIDRFFEHLRPQHPVVRYNWSLQADDTLDQHPDHQEAIRAETPLYYRTERQSLMRLPETGAIAFTIRVYLHPLEALRAFDQALPGLLSAIDRTPPPLADYKGFDELGPALEKYR